MTVDGVPNVRVCTEPIREGAVVEGQNVRWSLDFDFMSMTDKVGAPFTPVGFYYRTFIRPRAAWPLYEKFLRSAGGLGKLDPHAGHSRRYDTEHRHARVLVVGGGWAGRAGAPDAAEARPGVARAGAGACSSAGGAGRDGPLRWMLRRPARVSCSSTRTHDTPISTSRASRCSPRRRRSASGRAASSRPTPDASPTASP